MPHEAVTAEAPLARQWSTYQQAIFVEVKRGPSAPHLIVNALAGTGKSTTIEEAICATDEGDRVLACAFNKSIADALEARLPEGVHCKTFHKLGLQVLAKSRGYFPETKNFYVHDLARNALKSLPYKEQKEAVSAVAKLVSRAKGGLIAYADAIDQLVDEMGLEIHKRLRAPVVKTAAAIMAASADPAWRCINFDDMVYLPVIQALPLPTYDWVFVDETQDLNPGQLMMIRSMALAGARIVAVGDPNQAIYGWRGADKEAMGRMKRELSATVLPLSICYRCPTSVIAEAQRLVPSIEASPTAEAGLVATVSMTRCIDEATPGDFVISRTNAPLIRLCHTWLKDGVRARIRGRDIGEGLTSWIKRSGAGSIKELRETVTAWEGEEVKRLDDLGRDFTAVTDKAACLLALADCKPTIAELLSHIEELFAVCDDDGVAHNFIELSSTHRAKGLEADVVWLLRDTFMQSRWTPLVGEPREGEKVWKKASGNFVKRMGSEEGNLFYVAVTRARKELYYVVGSVGDDALTPPKAAETAAESF